LEIREKVRRGEERVMNILYVAPDVLVSHMGEFLKIVLKLFLVGQHFYTIKVNNIICPPPYIV